MLSLEATRENILHRIPPARPEIIPLASAHGRRLIRPLIASADLPPFDNSAMDGYAVRSADVASASSDHPVSLQLVARAGAGSPAHAPVQPGTCARIFTGAPVPEGADAVVMQEDTRRDPRDDQRVEILDRVTPWENIRFKGEDVRPGSTIVQAGDRLTAGRLGLAAALGVTEVEVGRQPRVALLATGSELVEPGRPLRPGSGEIYESNRALLQPLVTRAGGLSRALPLVPDTLPQTRQALADAFAEADVVVTSGGVSVGELDFVKQAFQELGGQLEFWKVAIKPGKPFVFGQLDGKFLFGLPGNPVSALVTFFLLVAPALRRWQGDPQPVPGPRRSRAAQPFENRGDRRHFVRARLLPDGSVEPAGLQASHRLASLAAADGLVDVPPHHVWPTGAEVAFLEFEA